MKHLALFYFDDQANATITSKDYKIFREGIQVPVRDNKSVTLDTCLCATATDLADKLDKLLNQDDGDEFYLHFSGHGTVVGIPMNEWIVKNADFIALLNHEKVKSCFFSSCKSSELVALAHKSSIPVVIGTLDENSIENDYAIAFQLTFYRALLASRTFDQAFHKALSELKIKSGREITAEDVLRSEGGEELEDDDQLNALQIVFATEKTRMMRMIPTNFLLEMEASDYKKPFCLCWSNDITNASDFKTALEQAGYIKDRVFMSIGDTDLPLLNNRGETDPFQTGDIILVVHCTKDVPLPNALCIHLGEDKAFKMDHYTILFCLGRGVHQDTLFDSPSLSAKIPQERIFAFDVSCKELFTKNSFIRWFDKQTLDFTTRKRVVLNFESAPNKQELTEIMDAGMYVRMFLARTPNEFQVNFLINWFRDKEPLSCPVLILDNIENQQMDIPAELCILLSEYNHEKGDLKQQFYKLHKSGVIIVIRNRSDDFQTTISALNAIMAALEESSGFNGASYKEPTLLFFLHGSSEVLPAEGKKYISRQQLSKPGEVTADVIEAWKKKHNAIDYSSQVASKVLEIAGTLNMDDFKECCPSVAIRSICDHLKLPHKQIVDI